MSAKRLASILRTNGLRNFLLLLSFAALTLVWSGTGRAADERDFVGTYAISNFTDGSSSVRFTLALRVFNYSGGDVSSASLVLQNSLSPGAENGSFPNTVSLADHEGTVINGDFTISREEYVSWQNGGKPSVRINYIDSNGNSISRLVELAEALAGEI